MSFSRANPGGWSTGAKLTSAQMNALDTDHSNSFDIRSSQSNTVQSASIIDTANGGLLHGTGSGTAMQLSNSSQILLSNSSQIQVGSSLASILATVTGAVIGANTTGAAVQVSGGANFIAPAASNYTFASNQTRTINASLHPQAAYFVGSGITNPQWISTPSTPVLAQLPIWRIQGFTTSVVTTGSNAFTPYVCDLTPFMHNGATLTSALLSFFPATHANLPGSGNMPAFGIFRVTPTTTADVFSSSINTTNCLINPGPSVQLVQPANVGLYNAQQSLTYTANQNNVIDKSSYTYLAIIWDEGGSNAVAGNYYQTIELTFGSIANLGFY